MDDDRITHLRSVQSVPPSKMREAAKILREEKMAIFAYNREMAEIIRNEYEEFLRAGFTAKQALELVKAKITPKPK